MTEFEYVSQSVHVCAIIYANRIEPVSQITVVTVKHCREKDNKKKSRIKEKREERQDSHPGCSVVRFDPVATIDYKVSQSHLKTPPTFFTTPVTKRTRTRTKRLI